MIAGPDPILVPIAGNTQVSVSVPASATLPVYFWADNSGQCLLALVSPGGSATFLAPNLFWARADQPTTFTFTAIQAFQNAPIISQYSPSRGAALLTNSTLGQQSLFFAPFDLPVSLDAYRINHFVSVATSISASNEAGSCGVTMLAGLYTQGTGASTNQVGLLWSGSAYISMSYSSNSNFTYNAPAGINGASVSQLSTTLHATNASTYLATSIGGFREIPFPIGSTLSPGRYWYAFIQSSTQATADFQIQCSYAQETFANQIAYQPFGGASSGASASFPQVFEGLGTYSAVTAAFPLTVALTGGVILGATAGTYPFFNFSGFLTNASI